MIRILHCIIIVLLPLCPISAKNVIIKGNNGLSYEPWPGGYTVKVFVENKNRGKVSGDIVIPETIQYKGETFYVTRIGDFSGCTKITSLSIPNSIVENGFVSFEDCIQLKSLYINCQKIELPYLHISNCINLKTITIGKDVKSIMTVIWSEYSKDMITFDGVPEFSKIIVEEGNTKYDSRNDCNAIIETATNKLILGCCSTIIPNDINTIDFYAFKNCKGLKSINVPNSVTSIKSNAFEGCNSLVEIIIPNSVRNIGAQSFKDCVKLNKAVVPDNAKVDYPNEVFHNCGQLEHLSGHTLPCPKYIYPQLTGNNPMRDKINEKGYIFYSTNRVYELMFAWQESIAKKGEFETTEQWEKRINTQLSDIRRKAKQDEFTEQAYDEYMEKYTPPTPKYNLGSYNADKGVFEVTSNGKSYYFKVPMNEAERFKANFSNSQITPTYGIVNDGVGLVSVSANVNGMKYALVDNYIKDESKDMVFELPPLTLDFGDISSNNSSTSNNEKRKVLDNSIDMNIPSTSIKNNNTFAVIIGNENYTKVSQVTYAHNDARVLAEYCKKTLGLPDKNIRGYEDATYGTIVSAVKDIQAIAEAYKGEINVIFYYAGHGIPNNASKDAYLLPVDADGRQMDICYPLSKLYQELGCLSAKSVTVFIDACFSGAQRGDGMLTAARGVAIKTKASAPQGNMVVFSAATDEQTAFPYTEKGHGMFTYFLLKKLRETKGDVTLGDLGDYIISEVGKSSIVENGRNQTPVVIASPNILNSWQSLKLK